MPRVFSYLMLLALAASMMVGGVAAQGQEATPQAKPSQPATPVALRVMTFNVWVGGDQVGLGQVVAAIQAAQADVVGLQEAEGSTRAIADALGWRYVDERMQIISRYPLLDPPGGNGIYTFVEVLPGQVVAMANVHLPSDPYGPEAVRDGATAAEVLTLEEETRLPLLLPVLEQLPPLVETGIPAFITGDFNTPSALDWTEETTAAREQVRFPLAWPVSEAAFAAGFADTFRAAHPYPVERPGLTWTPGYPQGTLRPGETFDRIDWVLASDGVEVVQSAVVGEAANPDVDIAVMPWPSDHRGVVSTLRLTPGTPPYLVAVAERGVPVGEPIVVRYHAPGEDGDRVTLVPAGGDAAADALMSLPPRESFVDGAIVFGSDTLAPGPYEVVLTGADGGELARIPLRVLATGARPAISVTTPMVTPGAPIAVSWENAPGAKWDWVGIYLAGDPDLYNYYAFVYTKSEIAGSLEIDEEAIGGPLEPGDYEVRLMLDDGYVVLATAPFTVAEEAS